MDEDKCKGIALPPTLARFTLLQRFHFVLVGGGVNGEHVPECLLRRCSLYL